MKKLKKCWMLLAFVAVVAGCEKVEKLPLADNALLPLAAGNSWTYTDSMIVTTSLPTIDTIVSEVTFEVLKETYVDTYSNSRDRNFRRIRGWELASDLPGLPKTGIFPLDDTLWVDGWANNFMFGFDDCPSVKGNLAVGPDWVNTGNGTISPGIASNLADGGEIAVHPMFHAVPRCIFQLGYVDSSPLVYAIVFQPLTYDDDPVALTTPAGTFNCRDFGAQLWADGIGMVQFEYDGVTAFITESGAAVTGTLNWKRTLKRYNLE
ncbi:MAG TPA: hypothetical protein VHS96_05735 [Bacteroidia bacterium]|nr:hypothetical protein [Bacteroidia bacterium]